MHNSIKNSKSKKKKNGFIERRKKERAPKVTNGDNVDVQNKRPSILSVEYKYSKISTSNIQIAYCSL